MPAGGVQVADEEKLCALTTIVFATVVDTSGVVCESPFGVACPFSTSIGTAPSTPENVRMPPAEPSEASKVHE
jgi:hypothetical protein